MRYILLLLLVSCSCLLASIGSITSLQGKASIERNGKILIAVLGNEIEKKDIINTKENSKVKISLNDNTIISLGKSSTLNIEEYIYDESKPLTSETKLNFVKGAFRTITGRIGKINPSKFKLKTKSASIGIRGTEIYGDQNKVACTKGVIDVTSFGVTYMVESGNIVDTFVDKVPNKPKVLDNKSFKQLQSELQVNKKNKSVDFTTKNSIDKKGTKKADAKNGTVTIKKDGSVSYTPKAGFEGTDTIVITKTEGDVSTSETITITVSQDPEVPTELNLDSVTITGLEELEDASLINNTNSSNTQESLSTASTEETTDNIKEDVDDSKIEEPTPILSLKNVSISTSEDSNIVTDKLKAISTSDKLKYRIKEGSEAPAGFVLNSDGTYSFDAKNRAYDSLKDGATQTLSIPVIVTDDKNGISEAIITIVVTGTNDLPKLSDISKDVNEGVETKLSGTLVATDVDSTSLTYKIKEGTTVPAGFVLNSDGTYSFDAKNSTYKSLNLRDVKTLSIPIIVTDDKNGTSEAILKINIAGTTNATGYQLSALVLNQDQSTEVNYGFKLSGTTAIDIFKNKVKLADYTQNITYFNSKLTGLEASILKTGELNHDFSNQSTYLSHSDIGNISFSHKLNSILYQGNYTIHSDNLGDFIVGWTNNSWTIDSNTYSYNDLLYSGLKSNSTILDISKIYTYKGFKGLRVDSDSSNSINNSYFTSQSNTSIILNAKTKSIIASNTETSIESSGSRFSVAKLNDDGTITAKTYEYKVDSKGIESNLKSDISAQLYGSQAQAIGAYGTIIESTVSNNNSQEQVSNIISEAEVATSTSSNKKNQLIETFFIDSNKANTSTGNVNFTGLSTLLYSSNNQSNETNNTISFSINRDTGTFTNGNILSKKRESSNLFSFDGNVSDLSSYYINDDNFGVKIKSYYDTSKKLVENSSWLVSIPDDIVDGKYVENPDNESSWGYWTSRIEDLETKDISKINAYSTWVAGIQTDVSVVQELIDSTTLKQLNFSGHMIGAVVSGSSFDAIKFDSNNVINLNFNFGAGTNTFSGDYAFKTASGSSLSGNIANGTASNNGFSLNDEVNTINGKYFGSGEIKSVGGTFNFGSGESNAIGSFKADKK